MSKKIFLFLIFILLVLSSLAGYFYLRPNSSVLSPLGEVQEIISTPLDRYNFENLRRRTPQASSVEMVGVMDKTETFTSYLFKFVSDSQTISGQLNLPSSPSNHRFPVIIMIRGFVDPSIYRTGVGTQNAAAVYAKEGFVTVAPDFAGFGQSDPAPEDTFEARVSKPVTVLDLIESVKQLEFVDPDRVFLWGHSNGGQIAISILEITQKPYPTTLWAPVTKGFPYNILFFTDESPDYGKALRKSLAQFEAKYDPDLFSIHHYYDQINAPILLHQGTDDEAVPVRWSNQFVNLIQNLKKEDGHENLDITYYVYPQADHNLRPGWNTVVERDLAFFKKHLTATPRPTPTPSSSP